MTLIAEQSIHSFLAEDFRRIHEQETFEPPEGSGTVRLFRAGGHFRPRDRILNVPFAFFRADVTG